MEETIARPDKAIRRHPAVAFCRMTLRLSGLAIT